MQVCLPFTVMIVPTLVGLPGVPTSDSTRLFAGNNTGEW